MADLLVFWGTCALLLGVTLTIKPRDWLIHTSRRVGVTLVMVGVLLVVMAWGLHQLP